jgi:hypothetical protein
VNFRICCVGRDFPERFLEQPRQMGFGVHEKGANYTLVGGVIGL